MKTLILIAAGFSASLSMHHCKNSKTTAHNKTEAVTATADSQALYQNVWYASELKGKEVPAQVKAWLMFNPGRVSGNTGCNSTTGDYELNGNGISFKQMATTRRACIGNADEVEGNFMAVISETNKWKITGDQLILSNGAVMLAKFKGVPLLKE